MSENLEEIGLEFWRNRIKQTPDLYFPVGFTDEKKENLARHLAIWSHEFADKELWEKMCKTYEEQRIRQLAEELNK